MENNKKDKVTTQSEDVESNGETLKNGRSIEKQIGVVFGKTLSIILVLIFAFILYASLFTPRTMANITAKLGMDSVSLYYSKVQFKRDKNINSLYIVVNKAIAQKKYKDTEKYLKKLFAMPNYDDFILFIESENLENVSKEANFDTISLMISVANEDRYLKNKYVESLIKNDMMSSAHEFAYADLCENGDTFTLGARIHWCYTYLIAECTDFAFMNVETTTKIGEVVNMLYGAFIENDKKFDDLTTTQQFDFLVLRYTLQRIVSDISLIIDEVNFENLSSAQLKEMRIKLKLEN